MGARHGPPQSTCSLVLMHLTWALRNIMRIPYTRHVSNVEVRGTTGCSPLSHLVTNRRLRLFGHIARSSSREDHHRALAAYIRQVPPDWKRPVGRPSYSLGSVQSRQTLAVWTLASRDCLEKGHYSRWMATYCRHSNVLAEYAMKERKKEVPSGCFRLLLLENITCLLSRRSRQRLWNVSISRSRLNQQLKLNNLL